MKKMYKIDIRIWRHRVANRRDRIKLRFVRWLVKPWIEIEVREDKEYGRAGFNDVKYNGESVVKDREGKVVKAKMRKQYNPLEERKGGRVVKTMPKRIKEVKEAQDGVPEMQIPE